MKPKEIAEISLMLWYLPLEKLEEVKRLVLSLKQRHGYKEPIDDSDEWSREDELEWTASSMKRLQEEDPWPDEDVESRKPGDV